VKLYTNLQEFTAQGDTPNEYFLFLFNPRTVHGNTQFHSICLTP